MKIDTVNLTGAVLLKSQIFKYIFSQNKVNFLYFNKFFASLSSDKTTQMNFCYRGKLHAVTNESKMYIFK